MTIPTAPSPSTPANAAERDSAWHRWTSPIDLAIAGGIAAWATLEALLVPSADPLVQSAFALAISLPLALRRRFPAVVMLVIAATLVLHAAFAGADATFNPFPSLLVATFTVAERIGPWSLAVALGVVPIAAMITAHVLGYFGEVGIEAGGALFLVFFVGCTWAAGRIVRHRALSLHRTRQGSEQRAAEAAASERRRIARELHDIVAHSLSIVALQAAAAEQFVERDPDRARRHLQLTRRTAQEALTEMRHLLDVLREDSVSYAPQPGLSGLGDLVAEAEAAGNPCVLEVDPALESVPDGLSLAAYRIVQESLTNARKHAPGARVSVSIARERTALAVIVVSGAPTRDGDAAAVAGGGRGIPGMAERTRVYGGSLEAGLTRDGGWRVHATLPWEGAR